MSDEEPTAEPEAPKADDKKKFRKFLAKFLRQSKKLF